MPVDAIYLDFQKAFDKVPHNRLIQKVRAHGIGGNVAKWIECWLSGRKQRVVLNGNKSQWCSVKSGVPQGSILGPLLFVIFINDIDDNMVNTLFKFADDTKLIGKVASACDVRVLQEDLQRLFSWSQDWQMLFNTSKCGVIHFGHNNSNSEYLLGDSKVAVLDDERDFGVIVDKTLKSTKQCIKAYNAANATLGMIRRSYVNICKQRIRNNNEVI